MDLEHKAAEELVELAAWSEDSLRYAHEHSQRKVVRLLEAIGVEIELEGA